ncbi:hypothetical protein LTR70_004397 [Exophiala xenobiotica]|uniref:non-specific serine/threonine protein kinase n=1 Tax=Lithohypha guttulata TaxID=1690604 RepID=A0ABR0JXF7_9EURO|nr:hypothetical protein LTR24_009305 [Lithohypha guttulata]KAK5320987.1 hypothetical protein LTR70_004397 [Exophiala xenobiotica]
MKTDAGQTDTVNLDSVINDLVDGENMEDDSMDIDYSQFRRKYCPGPDWCEENEFYEVGGLHPVLIGDTFHNGRYTVLHKLGYGGFSTVWLARDQQAERYVALKILSVAGSRSVNEIAIQRHIFGSGTARDDLPISRIIDRFTFKGPNGRHTCLVLQMAGPSLKVLYDQNVKLQPKYARNLAGQITRIIAELHARDIAVGDLTPGNILLGIKDLSSWSESDLYEWFGKPDEWDISPVDEDAVLPPNAPKHQYDYIRFGQCDMSILEPTAMVVDLNEAVYTGPEPDLCTAGDFSAANGTYASPEWWFGIDQKHTKASDIFALACIFYELRSSQQLMPPPLLGDGSDSLQRLLGEVPREWKAFQETRNQDDRVCLLSKERCGTESLETKLCEIGKWRSWHYMTPEQRRQHVFSDAYNEEERTDPDNGFDIENDLYTTPPPAKPSDEELHDFEDLLSKMLTYMPSQRITIEEVLRHPWLNKQYSDLDDPSAPWICRYDPGYKYFAASLWYRESVLGEVLTESEAMYFGGREEKIRNARYARKEEPAQDEEDTFYDCVEEIYCDADEYQDLDCSTPESVEPEHKDEVDVYREATTHPPEEEFSVTRLLALPADSIQG